MSLRAWDAASRSSVEVAGVRRPELVALPSELPTVAQLFTFARDAELRFETLRMGIDERTFGTRGEQHVLIDAMIRHPGQAKVTTSDPSRGTRGNYEIWISDGVTVRTYSGISKVGTERPARRGVRGLDNPDLPGTSTAYRPVTALQMESLPETFIHPAGLCQNVLATGDCRVVGTADHNGREVIILECHHPRTVEVSEDRPDHQLQVWFDRETGIVARLVETIALRVTRDAVTTSLGPNAALPPTAFTFAFPSDARMLY